MNNSEYLNALIFLQSFETFWAYCFLSNGELYRDECKDVAKKLISKLRQIRKGDEKILTFESLGPDQNKNTEYIEEVVNSLSKWIRSDNPLPYSKKFLNTQKISTFTSGLKINLFNKLNLKIHIPIVWSSQEIDFQSSTLKWGSHIPRILITDIPDDLESILSNSRSIAVVGDIRKSQDLMTYSSSSDYFSKMMLDFMANTRKFTRDNYGIFDKFTGDGFLVYFNEEICKLANSNFIECFINFTVAQLEYSKSHFNNWVKSIRKIPPGSCGLTIGADIGIIDFKEIDGHLFAIGDTIVWSNRVCNAGNSNEIIVNNILYSELIENKDISFETLESVTKAGESFVAYKMIL